MVGFEKKSDKPLVWSSISRMVTAHDTRAVGSQRRRRSSSDRRPSSARSRMSAARNVLLTLPIAKAVPPETGTLVRRFAQPLTPVQRRPSGQRIVTDTPGAEYLLLNAARRVCRAAAGMGVIVAGSDEPPGRRPSAAGGSPATAATGATTALGWGALVTSEPRWKPTQKAITATTPMTASRPS